MSKSTEDQQAVAAITQALVKNQAVPEASLAQIVGAEWASHVLAPRASDKECAAIREKLGRFEMTNPQAIPASMRVALRLRCEGHPMPAATQSCLLGAKDATTFGRCTLPASPVDKTTIPSINLEGKTTSILQ